MNNAIELNIGGLKCDNPNCDYIDNEIDAKDYEKYLNSKCPKCGEILLTEADFNNVKFLMRMAEFANKIFPKREPEEKVITMKVDMNGSGDMDFKIQD